MVTSSQSTSEDFLLIAIPTLVNSGCVAVPQWLQQDKMAHIARNKQHRAGFASHTPI
jgi:starvation-inducible outer membrane lipoprotein